MPLSFRFIKFKFSLVSRVYQSKLSPQEDHRPSLDSTTSATTSAFAASACVWSESCQCLQVAGGPGQVLILPGQLHPHSRSRGRRWLLVHDLAAAQVTRDSDGASHDHDDRCWSVGSLQVPYLLCHWHLATCASASIVGSLASPGPSDSDHSPWNPTTHPLKSSGFKLAAFVNPRTEVPGSEMPCPGQC
jgi:hypothetical protein